MMQIEINDNMIRLEESGTIKTIINNGAGNVATGSWPKIIDEFYPYCGNTIQTQVDSFIVQPNTFTQRTFDYKDPQYLKRQIVGKNRASYDIAKDFNTCQSTIRKYVNEHDIQKPLENPELLQELWNDYQSINDMADVVNAEIYEVKIALEQYNIINSHEENKIHS